MIACNTYRVRTHAIAAATLSALAVLASSALAVETFESYGATGTFADGSSLQDGLTVRLAPGAAADPATAGIGTEPGNQYMGLTTGGDGAGFSSAAQDPYEDGLAFISQDTPVLLGSTTQHYSADFSQSVFGFRAGQGVTVGLVNGSLDLSGGASTGDLLDNAVLAVTFSYGGGNNANGSGKNLDVFVRRTDSTGDRQTWSPTEGFDDGGGTNIAFVGWSPNTNYNIEIDLTPTAVNFTVTNLDTTAILFTGTSLLSETDSFTSARFVVGDVLNNDNAGNVFRLDNIAVPEPASLALFGLGLGVMATRRLRIRPAPKRFNSFSFTEKPS